MSSSGDIGGEVSGEEAAWRDLVARFDAQADMEPDLAPWPSREDLPDTPTPAADQVTSTDQPSEGPSEGPTGAFLPADRTRVIRYAGDPRSYSPPEEDETYVPVPLPPPTRPDAIAKAAWVALIGGPLYLLIGTFLHWTISAVEAFAAVAAFVGGFVTLVIKLGDRDRDDDDDGAVV
jgi:hypothetical protein